MFTCRCLSRFGDADHELANYVNGSWVIPRFTSLILIQVFQETIVNNQPLTVLMVTVHNRFLGHSAGQ